MSRRRTRNDRTFYYCLFVETEELTDEHGNATGEYRNIYREPVKAYGNISPASGYAQTEQFGNLDSYDKVISDLPLDCPIDENSVLFIDKEPEHNTGGDLMFDYTVRRVAERLGSVSVAVSKVKVS